MNLHDILDNIRERSENKKELKKTELKKKELKNYRMNKIFEKLEINSNI